MHARFRHLRFPGTEQFQPAAEVMEFIGRPLLVGANPDAVEMTVGVKFIRLELPPDLHRDWRIEAAKRDTHMSALARVPVEEFLKKARGSK